MADADLWTSGRQSGRYLCHHDQPAAGGAVAGRTGRAGQGQDVETLDRLAGCGAGQGQAGRPRPLCPNQHQWFAVRAVGPGVVRFAGRIKTRISVFGEHVEGDALAAALAHAARATGSAVAHYHVAPLLPSPAKPQGAHEWFVEFAVKPNDLKAFAAALDGHLHASVLDYAAHRDGGQLLAPVLSALPIGSFHAYLAAKGHLGGQHKVPQAWPDRTIAESLSKFSQFPGA